MLDKDLMPYFQPSAIRCLPDEMFKVGPHSLRELELDPISDAPGSGWLALHSGGTTGLLLTGPEASCVPTIAVP